MTTVRQKNSRDFVVVGFIIEFPMRTVRQIMENVCRSDMGKTINQKCTKFYVMFLLQFNIINSRLNAIDCLHCTHSYRKCTKIFQDFFIKTRFLILTIYRQRFHDVLVKREKAPHCRGAILVDM